MEDSIENGNSIPDSVDFQTLSEKLTDKDWQVRKAARMEFEKAGYNATKQLIKILKEGDLDARWEAAKALVAIKDPTAAPALVEAFKDESFEIKWLAAEALIALGEGSVPAILRALVKDPELQSIRQGAHHVLSDLERHGLLDQESSKVLDNLRMIGPWEHISVLAEKALESLGAKM
jgi:hypothetical protein